MPERRLLTGWGRTSPSTAEVVTGRAGDVDALAHAVKDLPPRGGIARGLGRSYGDPAQNGGGAVIELDDRARTRSASTTRTGTATAPAGVSLDDLLMRTIVPRGCFVPVTPGTRFVTVGGAIASDIHGKNHHLDGSFGNHVSRLSLLLADGSVVDIGPDRRPDLFWATAGGMGLTGVILDATVQLLPIETSRIAVDTDPHPRPRHPPDPDGRGRPLPPLLGGVDRSHGQGRPPRPQRADQGRPRAGRPVAAPLRRGAAGLRPAAGHRGAATRPAARRAQPPLRGRVQRVLVPQGTEAAGGADHLDPRVLPPARRCRLVEPPLRPPGVPAVPVRRAVRRGGDAADGGRAACRLGHHELPRRAQALRRRQPGPARFPIPGWTLALDLPAGAPGLAGLLHGLDDLVLEAGGRHYLAKDGHTTPDAVRRGYPRLEEWRAVRAGVDPAGVWASDQSRRLRLLAD